MSNDENPTQGNEIEKESEETPLQRLAASPDVQKAIADSIKRIPDLIDIHLKGSQLTGRRTTSWLLLWTFFLALIVVSAVTWLTFAEKISSDALAFLLGVIVGAAFTFVRDFSPSSNR